MFRPKKMWQKGGPFYFWATDLVNHEFTKTIMRGGENQS